MVKKKPASQQEQRDAITRLLKKRRTIEIDGETLILYTPSPEQIGTALDFQNVLKKMESDPHSSSHSTTILAAVSHMYSSVLKIEDGEALELFVSTGGMNSPLFSAVFDAMGLRVPKALKTGGDVDNSFLLPVQQDPV